MKGEPGQVISVNEQASAMLIACGRANRRDSIAELAKDYWSEHRASAF